MNRLKLAIILLPVVILACRFEIDYDRYAVVYGINNYYTANDLTYCADDAEDMAGVLLAQGYYVYLKIDNNATKTNMLIDIADIKSKANQDALFLLYFSGHGGPYDSGQNPEPPGSDSPDEAIVLYDGVPDYILTDDELSDLIEQIPCLKKVIIIDACNSGGFIGNELEADGIPQDYTGSTDGFFKNLGKAISLYANFSGDAFDISPQEALVIGAAGEREYSYEAGSPYNHGVFTYFLLETPKKGDLNNDGYVTVTEAYFYVLESIKLNWDGTSSAFAPHVSGGPVDYVLFKAE